MLVIAARNQNQLFLEGFQPRSGTGRAGRDGIIIIAHAVLFADKFNPVLYAAELPRDRADIVIRRVPLHQRRRHHQIIDVVRAGDADFLLRQQLARLAALRDAEHPVRPQINAILRRGGFARPAHAFRVREHQAVRHRVVPVEHQPAPLPLEAKNRGFRPDIFLKRAVIIQMVRRQVGDCRHCRAAPHIHQLEGGKLDNRQMLRRDLLDLGQQRPADIAAQMDGVPRPV